MVELAQAEIIQIFRKRAGINQGDFGSQAFNTSYESGRTKIKNIELGRRVPTPGDLEKIAALLKVPVVDLMPRGKRPGGSSGQTCARIFLSTAVVERFPGLDAYVDMLNNAVRISDRELIAYIGAKIAALLKEPEVSEQAVR